MTSAAAGERGLEGVCPVAAAARLAGRRGRVLLHTGQRSDGAGRWSFVASDPLATVQALGNQITVREGDRTPVQFQGDPISVVDELARAAGAIRPAQAGSAPLPVAIGYFGYELGELIEPRVRNGASRPGPGVPDLWFGIYGAVFRYDALTGRGEICGRDAGARGALGDALSRPSNLGPLPRFGPLAAAGDVDRHYRAGFERLKEYIRAGDVYQVNLARRLSAPVMASGDTLAVYDRFARCFPESFGAVLEVGGAHILSGSPERFLYREPGSRRLETRPIKGTRRRSGRVAHDRQLAAELASDEKERAEHLMIVDLLRSDLGRVAEVGSVRVEGFGRVVELPTLYHAVSTVSCQLRDDVSLPEVMRATFPGGSITGAPKIRAMEIIAELEPFRRGVYTGSIGYIGEGNALELSIAIRTAVIAGGEFELMVGGGVVADSTCERELEETEEKAASWRRSVFGTLI